MAKRKRREAKLAAARARKQLKAAKKELTDARIVFAEAEERRTTEKTGTRAKKRGSRRLGKRPSAKRTTKKRRFTEVAADPAPVAATAADGAVSNGETTAVTTNPVEKKTTSH